MLEDYIKSRINEAYDFMQNDSEKALGIFEEVLEIEPESVEAINGKGSTLMKLNRFNEAEKCFDRSLEISENSSAFLNKGNIYKHENDFDKAMECYDRALEINPDLENIVNILKSEIIDADDYSNELIKKGIELKNKNMLWDALDTLMKAIEKDPSCEIQARELIDEIKLSFEKEFEYDDTKFDTNSKIDRIKIQAIRSLVNENNPEKAMTLMDLALEMDENDINMLNHKGGVLFICSEYQKAIECFDKCLIIDENYTYALFNKGLVLRVLNRLHEALYCFNELLKIPKNYNKVKPYQREILNKLRSGTMN